MINSVQTYFIIEISFNANHSLNIAAFDVASPNTLMVTFSPSKSALILESFGNDLQLLVESLDISADRKTLSLRHPTNIYNNRRLPFQFGFEDPYTAGNDTDRNSDNATFRSS